jgi:hypothetical protein
MSPGGASGRRPPARTSSRLAARLLVVDLVLVGVTAALLVSVVSSFTAQVTPTGGPCSATTCGFYLSYESQSQPSPGAYVENLTVRATVGAYTTDNFALEIGAPGSVLPPTPSPATCAPRAGGAFVAFGVARCGAPAGGWYAVLVTENGSVASVFNDSYRWSGGPITPTAGDHLYVISSQDYHGAGLTLYAYGLGPYGVTGEALL